MIEKRRDKRMGEVKVEERGPGKSVSRTRKGSLQHLP